MPYQPLADGSRYALICFDGDGVERIEDDGRRMSEHVVADVRTAPPTDVFIASHGWKGDVPAAIDQYGRWFGALMARQADITAAAARRPGFAPLLIGLHWPSLPFGDEEFGGAGDAFAGAVDGVAPPSSQALIDLYAERLGDTQDVRRCLAVIVAAARDDAAAFELAPDVAEAYDELHTLLGFREGTLDGPPDDDHGPFDANEAFLEAQNVAFGDFGFGGLLAPLRQLSFWKMKKRARLIGEGGGHDFLVALMRATAPGAGKPDVRIHVMGHSFGCVLTSAMIVGPRDSASLRATDSLLLVQGALSLWSYCPAIDCEDRKPGYFSRLLDEGFVRGPIAVTRSKHDRAVGWLYPLAAKLGMGGATLAPGALPRYGGIGTFGAQGLGGAIDGPLRAADHAYAMAAGALYNFDASEAIARGGGLTGAHNDIDGPEVAHLWWELARNAG